MSRLSLVGTRQAGALSFALLLALPGSAALAEASASPALDPAERPAEILPKAAQSLLLDAVRAQAGYVAVGERGHVLASDDGRAWRQLAIPTRSTLTAVASVEGRLWAAGHDGHILHSADGGQSWQRQRLSLWSVEADDPDAGVPVLDLLFTDASQGFAIGAYTLMLRTRDGGATWDAVDSHREALAGAADTGAQGAAAGVGEAADDWSFSEDDLDLGAEADPHLNAMARTDSGALVIAGERGTFLRSRDGGESWESKPLPYEGSMFGVLAWGESHLLVFGLRGNVYESQDLGDSWIRVDTGTSNSLMGGTALPEGGAVLVGANGTVLWRANGSEPFRQTSYTAASGETPLLAGALPHEDGHVLLIGARGAGLFRPE